MKHIIKVKYSFLPALLFFVFSSCTRAPANTDNDGGGNSNLTDTTMLNVSYGPHEKQVYDIFLPKNRDTSTPVILMIHGGAWKGGQKEQLNSYIDLIKAKWNSCAIVNMNYRLASNANNIHHNEIIADIGSVVNHINSNQTNYHISNKIGIVGLSAGGQLAMIYAYKYNNNIKCVGNFFGPSIISDRAWYDSYNTLLGGCIGDILTEYVGQPWDTTAYNAVSPFWNVTKNAQPTIIFHGNLDSIVPQNQSLLLSDKLSNLGVTNKYYTYNAVHGFDSASSDDAINKLVIFFKVYVK